MRITVLFFSFLAFAASAQSPAPYPVVVDSERESVQTLTVFQANQFEVKASFKSGGVANIITAERPFLWWYPYGATNSTIVTSSWTVVSSTGGVVNFVLSPSDLNFTTGFYAYQIGLDDSGGASVIKEGQMIIRPASGVVGADIVFAATPVNWPLISWTGLPNWIEDAPGTPGIFSRQSNAWVDIEGRLGGIEGDFSSYTLLTTFQATNAGVQASLAAKTDLAAYEGHTQSVWAAVGVLTAADLATSNALNTRITANTTAKLDTTTHAASTTALWGAVGTMYPASNPSGYISIATSGSSLTSFPERIELGDNLAWLDADGITAEFGSTLPLTIASPGGVSINTGVSAIDIQVGRLTLTNENDGVFIYKGQYYGNAANLTNFPPGLATTGEIAAVVSAIATKVDASVYSPATAALWSAIGGIVSADNALTNVTGAGRLTATKSGANVALTFDATGLATGTPIYVENNPSLLALSNAVALSATGTPLYVEAGTGTLVAASIAEFMPGSAISNEFQPVGAYAVNGQNITGRWFAVGQDVSELYGFIGGGLLNIASGDYAAIGGGLLNIASGDNATVSGGSGNNAAGQYTTIGGGQSNTATNDHTTVGGGLLNNATGVRSTIPGGWKNEAFNESFAAGVNAKATNSGAFVWASDSVTPFGSRGDNTFNVRSQGGMHFLTPGIYMSDTNGLGWGSFTPTGGIQVGAASFYIRPSGDISHDSTNTATLGVLTVKDLVVTGTVVGLAGYATNGQWAASVAGASNLATSASLAIGAGATNYANTVGAAIGLVATNFHVSQGVIATNAQITASNALAAAVGVGLVTTNLHLAQGVIVTGAVNGVVSVGLVATNAAAGVVTVGLVASNALPKSGGTMSGSILMGESAMSGDGLLIAFEGGASILKIGAGTTGTIGGVWNFLSSPIIPGYVSTSSFHSIVATNLNFSPASYLSVAAYQSAITNSLRLYAGSVTQNQVGVWNNAFFDGTNLFMPRGGTNWVTFTGTPGP